MKKENLLSIFIFLLASNSVFSQATFKHKVFVWTDKKEVKKEKGIENKSDESQNIDYKIFKLGKVSVEDTFKLDPEATLIEKRSASFDDTDHEMEKKTVYPAGKIIPYKKKTTKAERFYADGKRHKANLHVSKDTLYVNFWLCKGYYDKTKAERDSCYYQPNEKYFIRLENRQSMSFIYTNWEVSTLVIPFKYQFGFEWGAHDMPSDVKTDINVNAFVGYRAGKVRFFNDQYKGMTETKWSYTFGGFFGLNATKIDSASTSLSDKPLAKERNVPTFCYGVGVVFNIRDFNIGAFLGADAGLNTAAYKWNYHTKPWLGFGIGYRLGFIGKFE